jgi:hypothetical protein
VDRTITLTASLTPEEGGYVAQRRPVLSVARSAGHAAIDMAHDQPVTEHTLDVSPESVSQSTGSVSL